MSNPIGNLGTIPTAIVNGRALTDLSSSLIILYGRVATDAHFTTLRKQNGTAGYQVTTGKTLTIVAIQPIGSNDGANNHIKLLYGDTDVGLDGASAPTTPKYIAGDSGFIIALSNTGTAGNGLAANVAPPLDFQVPATKYAAIACNNGGNSVIVYGYEA